MRRRGFLRNFRAGLMAWLGVNPRGNSHLSDGEWQMLEAPQRRGLRPTGDRPQWTEDNLD